MARHRTGIVVYKRDLSPILTIFRLAPEPGHRFPPFRAGQYIALRREDGLVTRQAGTDPDGKPIYVPDTTPSGEQKTGPVTHAYSIASAPWEQERYGHLEFYIVLAMTRGWVSGRLSSVLMRLRADGGDHVGYVDRITGDFTLDPLTTGYEQVIMVGTGTGLSPFVSMIKQLHHQAATGHADDRRYVLVHTNRVFDELAYHARLLEIEREGLFDFTYIATVSRPSPEDRDNRGLGVGRGNNVLRHILDLPTAEDEAVAEARARDGDVARAERDRARAVPPTLPRHLSARTLRAGITPSKAIILTCGNPASMADIERTAARAGLAFKKEDW